MLTQEEISFPFTLLHVYSCCLKFTGNRVSGGARLRPGFFLQHQGRQILHFSSRDKARVCQVFAPFQSTAKCPFAGWLNACYEQNPAVAWKKLLCLTKQE